VRFLSEDNIEFHPEDVEVDSVVDLRLEKKCQDIAMSAGLSRVVRMR